MGDVVSGSGVSRFLVVVDPVRLRLFAAGHRVSAILFTGRSRIARRKLFFLMPGRARLPLPANSSCVTPFPEVTKRCAICSRMGTLVGATARRHLLIRCSAYYRSHRYQSWISSLTAISGRVRTHDFRYGRCLPRQAQLTCDRGGTRLPTLPVFSPCLSRPDQDRATPDMLRLIRETSRSTGQNSRDAGSRQKLAELRKLYEPYVYALASRFDQTLPPWFPRKNRKTTGRPLLAKTTNGTAGGCAGARRSF